MRIVLLTPGTGSYYCGVCMRDNALAKELIRMGHDAVMLPMYLPLTLDESPAQPQTDIFYGGINVFLQQKSALFRNAPRWVDRLLNHPALLQRVGRMSGMTGGTQIGELTHSMLLGREGNQTRELDKLIEWFRSHGLPDVIWLSTALLAGLAAPLQRALGVPVLCSLQGEDEFLDHLPPPWRERCWATLAQRAADIRCFIAPSRYFASLMQLRLRLSNSQLKVIPNAIALADFGPATAPANVTSAAAPAVPTIGFLARLIEAKGLGLLIDAFLQIKKNGRVPCVRLRCAGAMTENDARYVEGLRAQLVTAGCSDAVEFLPNLDREEKVHFLRSLTVFSVPALYSEAFGLYLLEALAAGIPVVQPRHAAFPEIVETTGGGLLFNPGDASALAARLEELLLDPARASALGACGRSAVFQNYAMPVMARQYLAASREMIDAHPPAL
jgi:glycosyltransferase involved in cell wall biosynthesis